MSEIRPDTGQRRSENPFVVDAVQASQEREESAGDAHDVIVDHFSFRMIQQPLQALI
jgi:hypothetical protein